MNYLCDLKYESRFFVVKAVIKIETSRFVVFTIAFGNDLSNKTLVVTQYG